MNLLPLAVLIQIAAVMLPTIGACAWLLREAEIFGPRHVIPPPPKLRPRKPPTEQGPETRFFDRLPPGRYPTRHG